MLALVGLGRSFGPQWAGVRVLCSPRSCSCGGCLRGHISEALPLWGLWRGPCPQGHTQ